MIRVVLPLPLGPKRPTMRPGSMAKVTPSKAVVAPKRLTRPLLSRMLTLFLLLPVSHKGRGSPPAGSPAGTSPLKSLSPGPGPGDSRRRRIRSPSSVTKRPAVRWLWTSSSRSISIMARCMVFGFTPASAARSRTEGKLLPRQQGAADDPLLDLGDELGVDGEVIAELPRHIHPS